MGVKDSAACLEGFAMLAITGRFQKRYQQTKGSVIHPLSLFHEVSFSESHTHQLTDNGTSYNATSLPVALALD